MLQEYQDAKKDIDKALAKDFTKENAKLEQELAVRRARRKNKAQLLKAEKFNEIEQAVAEKEAKDELDRDKLKENLHAVDQSESRYKS